MNVTPVAPAECLTLRDVTDAMCKMMAAIDPRHRALRSATDVRGAALAILSPTGGFLAANASAAAMLGFAIADLNGQSIGDLIRDSDRQRILERFSASASSAFESFGTVLRGHGSLGMEVAVHKQAIADGNGKVGAFLVLFEQPVPRQDEAQPGLRHPDDDFAKRYMQLMQGQEGERRRVSLELHDGLGQSLTLVKLMVEDSLLRLRRGGVDEASAILDTTVLRIRAMIGEMRDICHALRPRLLDEQGLAPALDALCRQTERASGSVIVVFDCLAREDEVPDPLKAEIYRVAQEAMHNVVKHAMASEIRVTLLRVTSGIALNIRDNGIGFERLPCLPCYPPDDPLCAGLGLLGMRARVESAGGTFSLQPADSGGTVVTAMWPA